MKDCVQTDQVSSCQSTHVVSKAFDEYLIDCLLPQLMSHCCDTAEHNVVADERLYLKLQ